MFAAGTEEAASSCARWACRRTEAAYVAAAAAAMAASAFCTRTLRVRGVLAPPRELLS